MLPKRPLWRSPKLKGGDITRVEDPSGSAPVWGSLPRQKATSKCLAGSETMSMRRLSVTPMSSRKPHLRFLSKDWPSPISLSNEEVQLLKLLKAAGSHDRTISNLNSRSGAERLVKIGYVTDYAVTLDTVPSVPDHKARGPGAYQRHGRCRSSPAGNA
jgi:hypothetical protein